MNNSQDKIKLLQIINALLTFLESCVTIISFIIGFKTGILWFYIVFVFLLMILIVYICYKNQISKYILKKIMNATCPDKIYKLEKKELIYEFTTRENIRFEKNFKVKVLHDGFKEIPDKYKWTGDTFLIPQAKYDNQEIELKDQKYGMQRYLIKFKNGKSFSKNDKMDEEMGMIIDNIIDKNHTSSLHLSSGVYEITDTLILHLIFDNSLRPKNIRQLEYIHYSDDEHFKCDYTECTYNHKTDKKEVIWTIKNPIYGGKYMIDWEFEEK